MTKTTEIITRASRIPAGAAAGVIALSLVTVACAPDAPAPSQADVVTDTIGDTIVVRTLAGSVWDMEATLSSDNQDENVATIKVRTRGRDATSARTMAVAGRRGKWERGGRVSGTAGMRRPCSADSGVFHRPGAASVASRDGAVEGGFSEG